ncbi:MAG TPA: twin-arginine translocase TatA/TatE family subunit, partial [Chloroflexota bacterium]
EPAVFEGLLQPMHLLIILVIALVVFGPSRLPELGRTLGKGVRDLRSGMSEIDDLKKSVTDVGESLKVDPAESGKGPTRPA